MRLSFSAAIVAGLLTSHAAFANDCARPADKTAFDIVGLKSQLMVTALTCAADEKYNSFVVRYRPVLISANNALNGYFGRVFGRRAQAQYDDYITSLANAQSQEGIKHGTLYCSRNIGLFDEVMGLKNPNELGQFAGSKNPVQPIDVVECAAAPPPRPIRQASAAPATKPTTQQR